MPYYLFDSRTFRDRKVRENLTLHEHKWLWAVLLAGEERSRLPGLIKLRLASLADEAQVTPSVALDGLALMESANMIVIDRDAELIQLPNAPKHNVCPNANVLRAWYAIWEELPHCALRYEHIRLLVHAVNLQTASLDQAWAGTFGAVLRAWDAGDPDIRYLAQKLRGRWVRHQPPAGQEPAGNGYPGNSYPPNGYTGNGSGGNRSASTVTSETVTPVTVTLKESGSGNGSGRGSGSGRDGYRGNRNVEPREIRSTEISQNGTPETDGNHGVGADKAGTSVAGHEAGGPPPPASGGRAGGRRSRVAELARARGTPR